MSTETEIVETKEEKTVSPESTPKENEYKIFDYFKEHTGLLVTCVSALVAVMSFVLRFAVGRMNYAYLAYWEIASLHANTNNQSELDMVVCVLLYMFSLMLIRGFLGKMSDTFRYYVPLLSMINRSTNISRKEDKKLLKKLHKITIQFNCLSPKARKSARGKAIKKKIERIRNSVEKDLCRLRRIKKARRRIVLSVILQTAITVFLAYLLGSLFLVLLDMGATIRESFQSSRIIVIFIVIELLGQYIPACIASRRLSKQYKDEEVSDKVAEMLDSEIPKLPFEGLGHWKIKTILTDRVLNTVMVYMSAGMVILLVTMSFLGTLAAEKTRSFPIYSDGSTLFAVVYTSGSTRFMEEAVVQDGTLVIDTTKQRVITSDDISYHIEAFDNVSVIRIDDAEKIEQSKVSFDRILDVIGSFFDTLKTKIGEAMVENEGSIPRTEYQP